MAAVAVGVKWKKLRIAFVSPTVRLQITDHCDQSCLHCPYSRLYTESLTFPFVGCIAIHRLHEVEFFGLGEDAPDSYRRGTAAPS